MDFPILIIWMIPFSFLGESGVFLHFIPFFDEIPVSIQNSPRWDAAFCGVTSGAIMFAHVPYKRTTGIHLNKVIRERFKSQFSDNALMILN